MATPPHLSRFNCQTAKRLLTSPLMVRSIAQRCVSNHAGPSPLPILRDALAALGLLRMRRNVLRSRCQTAKRHRPVFCQATGPPVVYSRGSALETRGSGAPGGASTIPRLRGAARVLRRRQVYAVCANVHETRSPLGAPPRRFWPSGLLQSAPGPTFRPPDPAGFRLRSSGRELPTMASPRSRAGQHPEAPGDGLRDHPQAPHPLRQSRRL